MYFYVGTSLISINTDNNPLIHTNTERNMTRKDLETHPNAEFVYIALAFPSAFPRVKWLALAE